MADGLGPEEEEGATVLDMREAAGRLLRGPEPEVPVPPRAGLPDRLAGPGGSPFMANAKCAWGECPKPSELHPHLILRPPDGLQGTAEAHLSLGVCAEHATTNIDDLVSDEGWAVLVATFRETGRIEPERSKTEVQWLSLD